MSDGAHLLSPVELAGLHSRQPYIGAERYSRSRDLGPPARSIGRARFLLGRARHSYPRFGEEIVAPLRRHVPFRIARRDQSARAAPPVIPHD